jgi:hypothetical protein
MPDACPGRRGGRVSPGQSIEGISAEKRMIRHSAHLMRQLVGEATPELDNRCGAWRDRVTRLPI